MSGALTTDDDRTTLNAAVLACSNKLVPRQRLRGMPVWPFASSFRVR